MPYLPGTGALRLLIDCTGDTAEGDGEWRARKHGSSQPRDWRNVHLGIDAETLEIRGVEITGSRTGDTLVLLDKLHQIPADRPPRVWSPQMEPAAPGRSYGTRLSEVSALAG